MWENNVSEIRTLRSSDIHESQWEPEKEPKEESKDIGPKDLH